MMTETERREIDKRVAVAMGWVWQPLDDEWHDPQWLLPDGTSAMSGGRYTTDAAAADLVRVEIERRGWYLIRHDYISSRPLPAYPAQHRASIYRGGLVENGIWGVSDDSPHLALCLAFLAAVEADGAGKETGE